MLSYWEGSEVARGGRPATLTTVMMRSRAARFLSRFPFNIRLRICLHTRRRKTTTDAAYFATRENKTVFDFTFQVHLHLYSICHVPILSDNFFIEKLQHFY